MRRTAAPARGARSLRRGAVVASAAVRSAAASAPRRGLPSSSRWPTPPINLDPRVGTDEASQKAHQLLYSSLLRIDDDLRVVPDLAERCRARIRRPTSCRSASGVRFHDGRELTADDVVYTFRSFLDPAFRGRSGAYRLLASVTRSGRLHRRVHAEGAVRVVPDQPGHGHRAGTDSGAANARHADRHRAVSARRVRAGRSPRARAVRRITTAARRANAGVVLKVVPDDTMRGLELRKGTVDLVVNDLAPDIVWQLQREGRLQRRRPRRAPTTPTSGSTCATRSCGRLEVRQAIGYAIDREAIVAVPAPRARARGGRHRAADVVGVRAARSSTSATIPREARRLLDEAGFPDPDGDGPLPRFRLTLKTSTAEVYRVQAAVIQQDLARVGIAVDVRSSEFATLFADVVARQLPAVHAAVRRRDRSGHAAARLSLDAGAAGRLQPGPLRQRRGRSPDRRGRRGAREAERARLLYAPGAAADRARTCRTSACGTRRTSPSYQPTSDGRARSRRSPTSRS